MVNPDNVVQPEKSVLRSRNIYNTSTKNLCLEGRQMSKPNTPVHPRMDRSPSDRYPIPTRLDPLFSCLPSASSSSSGESKKIMHNNNVDNKVAQNTR
jgi:hypothetical protein